MSCSKTVAAKDKARQEVAKLVARYKSLPPTSIKKYTEADTRREFIEPLFGALGWDVYSREEVAEEVKAAAGRVDYVFKLHGVSQFYLEAKALRAELTKPEYIKQAITYAYNKGITWAVLTDFEGLQLYNAQTGRLFINLSCDSYLADFDDLGEKKIHDDLVALADKMLELNKRLAPIRDTFCNERDELLHQIERTDKEIDNLVYDLYRLTAEERKIVEVS